ncbi:TAXI family TRAP transporter solute-binding subunit [Aeromonas bivalvium]|uniref:TAXI family TRAP transporter solute-binding subunit n=1 Tax=Aeromonas bivalvium TaxID=440079 RepID=UPI001ADFC9F8|nr:TAXI family TRAP transporter solute-binding subunit [Aeromonas bivalvium]
MRPRIPALLAPLFALLCWGTSAHASDYLTISTGALTGVYYPVGGALCRLLNEQSGSDGLRCSVRSTKGSLANLQDLQEGKSQLALVQSDVLHHTVHGTGPFADQGPNRALRSLYRLHHESVALLVGEQSRIGSLGDLPGKRVDLGSVNGGDRVTIMALVEAMGWQAKDFAPTAGLGADRLQGLCDGSLDAAFVVAGQPNQVISDLTGRCKARLLPIDDARITGLIEGSTYYERGRIPANLYPGQTMAIPTLGVRADLVTQDTLPVETVHRLRRVMDEHLKQFTRLHPSLITLTQETMTAPSPAPSHAAMQDDPRAPEPLPPTLMPESLQPDSVPSEALPTQTVSGAEATEESTAPEGETAPAQTPSGAAATGSAAILEDEAAILEGETALAQTPSDAAATGSAAILEGETAPAQTPSGAAATGSAAIPEAEAAPAQTPSGAAATGSAATPEAEAAPAQPPSGAAATEPAATP